MSHDDDPDDPGRGQRKRPSGSFAAVQRHAQRVRDILLRCDAVGSTGAPCTRDKHHDPPHRDAQDREWLDP